ncbi:MAG: hypothetical protein KC656_16555 [Myxococcales bacterium]|nr:hypothetical protein [Myxococcales bacterium]MCB9668965.1 hypothetical protein [Alphaproteobacteria bacterium]MCB9691292.1 hypothetical protein [Alphaproteobacteria bacterium]
MSSFDRRSVFADDLRGNDRTPTPSERRRSECRDIDDLFGDDAPPSAQKERQGRMRIRTW